jgi:hypothetical protein
MAEISPEETASFRFGGHRARPRKGIEAKTVSGEVYLKPPGSCLSRWPSLGINIDIECCKDCQIYIIDPCERVQISECDGCRIVVGPCVGSLMLFECTNCTIAVAAPQVRLRDSFDCELRVFAPTSECVVIETSKRLRIGAWDVAYAGLGAHFARAGWLPNAHNYCDEIFDFSPPEGGGKNWSPLGADPSGKWCQLTVESTEGFAGGRVTEARADMPTVVGCECPCSAPDGTTFEAEWYSSASAAKEAASAVEAKKEAKAVERASTQRSVAMAASPPSTAGGGFVGRLLNWLGCALGLGRAKPDADSAVDIADVQIKGAKTQTQVCIVS